MLTFFRRGGTGQVIIGAVVFAVIVVFVMEFRPGRQGGGGISRDCAVKVQDACVDRKEYFAAQGLLIPRGIPPKKVRQLQLKKVVMEGLVDRELLLKEADRLGVSVSEEELDDELSHGRARVSLPTSHMGQLAMSLGLGADLVRLLPVRSTQTEEFDYKIYERVVRNYTNRSPREFKEMQKREMIAQRVRDLVRSRVRVSEVEAYTSWEREHTRAVARVVSIKRDWIAKWVVDGSDGAVDDWALKNDKPVEEAWKQAQVAWKADCPLVSEILLSVEEETGDATKTEQRQKAEAALARVKKGEPFEVVAKSVSEAPSAVYGGDTGCLNEGYGQGVGELLEATKRLKPGQLSGVVETKRGFHVLKLQERVAEKDLEKRGRRAAARRLAVPAMATELAKELSDKIIAKVKEGTKLEEATNALALEYASRLAPAKKPLPGTGPAPAKADASEPPAMTDALRPRVETTAPFSMLGTPLDDAAPGEAPAAKVFDLAKADDILEKPLRIGDGFAVIQLKEKTPAKKEDFAKDRVSILRALRQSKEEDALGRYVSALRSKVKDKIVLDQRLLEEGPADDTSGDG